ncbi:MAG: thiolase family protein [Betaproteobacteria bacterium]
MDYRAEIPYGCYWSTPFARWQGAYANLHSLEFAAQVTRAELERRGIAPGAFDHGVLGLSVPQKHSFYGLPWLAGMAGLGHVAGPTVMQACATGVRALLAGAQEIQQGLAHASLAVTCDRTSNGPHLYYPNPKGPGGTGAHEDWVMDNFSCDPLGPHAMIRTAENVAKKHGISTAEQHEVVLMREAQYRAGVGEFQSRFFAEAPIKADEGVRTSTAEKLAQLKPVIEGGTVTYGAQTFPADGNAAIVLCDSHTAKKLSRDAEIRIRLLGFGQSRAELAYMPEAPVAAAGRALDQAGLRMRDMKAVKTHNPFAANDVLFSRATGVALEKMNNYGCSLVWGHPQAPMGTRSVIELVEELAAAGGGYGLFTGCAAGDSAMAVVLAVGL